MFPLYATLAGLAAAPLLSPLLTRAPRVSAAVDALVVVVIGGLVLLEVLPQGWADAGWPAALLLGLGLAGGTIAHGVPRGARGAHLAASAGLVLHGLTDGAALAAAQRGDPGLGWLVALHTVPVGLATWRLGVITGGAPVGLALLATSAAATLAGWLASGVWLERIPVAPLALVQCLLAGVLLHVLGHLGSFPRSAAAWAGAAVGVVVVLLAHG